MLARPAWLAWPHPGWDSQLDDDEEHDTIDELEAWDEDRDIFPNQRRSARSINGQKQGANRNSNCKPPQNDPSATDRRSQTEPQSAGDEAWRRGDREIFKCAGLPRRAWSKKICTRRSPWYPRKKEVRKRRCEPRKVDGHILLSSTGLRRHQPHLFLVWKSKSG